MLEAIISLAILAIVLTLAFSGRSLINNRRLVGAARTIATEIRWVEQRARAERRCWRLVFELGTGLYRIESREGAGFVGSSCSGGTWQRYAERGLPTGIDLVETTFPSDMTTVSPYGNPSPAGTVLLRSPNGEERRITVEVGGRVTIESP